MHSSELLHTRLSVIPRHNCPGYLDTSVHCHRLLSESETYIVLSHQQQSPAHCDHFLTEAFEITVNRYQMRTNTSTETNSRQYWKEACGGNSPCVASRGMSDCPRHCINYLPTPLSPQTNMTLTPCTASFIPICNTFPTISNKNSAKKRITFLFWPGPPTENGEHIAPPLCCRPPHIYLLAFSRRGQVS